MSWQKWNIHGRLLLYFLLESYRIIAFGQITNIQLKSDNDASYIGKVEIGCNICIPVFGCSLQWCAVCHDGDDDDDRPSWNLKAATAACKQLGYEAGWNRSETGLTSGYSIEGFSCTDLSDSHVECTSDGPEYCGCSTLQQFNTDRCNDHWGKDQAAVECYNHTDVSLHLLNVGANEEKLEIEYRGEQYDVCFDGASKNWSMDEADVACRQMGYPQGALSTKQLNVPTQLSKSFADFSCNGGESNLFSCISKPPRSKSCGDLVSLTCQGNGEAAGEIRNQQGNTGMIVGITIGVISVLLIVIVAVLCHVKYRRKTLLKRQTQSQHQQPASTMHPNNVYEAGSAEYAEVQDQVQDPNTDYSYAYSHARNGRVSSTQPVTDTTRISNQSGTNSEGWADNTAYNSYGDDGLTNHNSDGVVLRPSNLPAQNQTGETEGWAENNAYARRSDATVSGSQNDEGWQDNNVYVTN